MSTTPTTQELSDGIVAQVDGNMAQTTPLLDKTFTRVWAKVLAGANVLLWKYASWMLLQMFVQTASMRETVILGQTIRPLVYWGRLFGAGDPLPATRAELTILVPVTVQTGFIAAGAQYVYPATGIVYVVTASVALNASTVVVRIRAASDQQGGQGAGVIGNLLPGAIVQAANPLPNVARSATVQAQIATGSDEESPAAYRARVMRRVQQKPQGGAYADYQLWGEENAGILHVYPYTGAPGEVDVYVEATTDSSGSADGIPTSAQLSAVLASINLDVSGQATRRPANAAVNVLPIVRQPFDVVVTGLVADDLASAEASVLAAIDEYLRSREPYIVGLSIPPRADRVTLAALAGIVDDVASSVGGSVATVALKFASESINAYTLGKGEKAKAGAVTFV